jgi:hypothetical protein
MEWDTAHRPEGGGPEIHPLSTICQFTTIMGELPNRPLSNYTLLRPTAS